MSGDPQHGVSRPLFSRASLLRIVLDLLADDIARSRGRSPTTLDRADWGESTRLRDGGLDLDSLEILSASAALSEFFHLHEYGAEDYLLQLPTVGEWCDLVAQSLAATGTHLTFRTSGSTGEPKRCTHAVADMLVEVEAWAALLGSPSRILSLVPAHHIYGAIFTALLPDRLAAECVNAGLGGAKEVSAAVPGTVIVGTPTNWAYLARALPALPPGVTGVSSSAPMSAELAGQLDQQGLARLVEIYGSSETGGIGHRDGAAGAFALLDHWRADGDHVITRASATGSPVRHELMDVVQWVGGRRFHLRGRRDGAVQIGGHNVFPERVRRRLLDHDGVADAAVRFEAATGRLKAFLVPAAGAAADGAFAARLDAWCAEALTDAERPRRIAVGAVLPRNDLGKLIDW